MEKEIREKAEELQEKFYKQIWPAYTDAYKTKSFSAIRHFAELLNQTGEQQAIPKLVEWRNAIHQALERFSIQEINQHLEFFGHILELVKELTRQKRD